MVLHQVEGIRLVNVKVPKCRGFVTQAKLTPNDFSLETKPDRLNLVIIRVFNDSVRTV